MKKWTSPNPIEETTLLTQAKYRSVLDFGVAKVAPGDRLPKEGYTSHEGHEYSFILSGELSGESGGEAFHIKAGELSYIPLGEEHYCQNDGEEEVEIFFVMVSEEE